MAQHANIFKDEVKRIENHRSVAKIDKFIGRGENPKMAEACRGHFRIRTESNKLIYLRY